MGVGGCSGRQVVGQLDESQSTMEALSLLLQAALGSSSLAALLLLHDIFLISILFIRLEKLHGILLLLVLCSGLALWLHLGGRRGALLTSSPVSTRIAKGTLKYVVGWKTALACRVFTYLASHSATALLSTDWAFPWPSFGSSLFRREKGCLGQWRLACVNRLPHPAEKAKVWMNAASQLLYMLNIYTSTLFHNEDMQLMTFCRTAVIKSSTTMIHLNNSTMACYDWSNNTTNSCTVHLCFTGTFQTLWT